jgi:hypothetical protein
LLRSVLNCNAASRESVPVLRKRNGSIAYRAIIRAMAKRIMIAVVGAGIGALAGLLIDYLGAGTPALFAGAAAGAVIPQFVLGSPGK